jgi:CDP-archaeol synthase
MASRRQGRRTHIASVPRYPPYAFPPRDYAKSRLTSRGPEVNDAVGGSHQKGAADAGVRVQPLYLAAWLRYAGDMQLAPGAAVREELYRMLAALLLVIAANTAPWVSGWLLRDRLAQPLDCGVRLSDGARLLGDHKTWRGLCAGECACAIAAGLLGYSFLLGLEFATLSLAADAASSLLKRRLRLAPGAEVPGVDQLPESLVPLWILATPLGISVWGGVVIAMVFLCLDLASGPLRRTTAQG